MKLNLGENIRFYRKKLGWTQEQLADRLGVSYQSVSRWEIGASYPDMELLPELARIFSVTTDTLLGCGEPEEKLTRIELQEQLSSAIYAEDAELSAQILRMIRYEYFEEFSHCFHVLMILHHDDALLQSEDFTKELRTILNEYLERGTDQLSKPEMILLQARLWDEDSLDELMDKHSIAPRRDLSRTGLYLEHVKERMELDTFRLLMEEKRFCQISELLLEPRLPLQRWKPEYRENMRAREEGLPDGNPAYWRDKSARKLRFLHMLNEVTPDERHPISGNGKLDLWIAPRLEIGFRYAAQLAASGNGDLALTALEDCAELIDQLVDFPGGMEQYQKGYYPEKCPKLTCSAPELSHIVGYRVPIGFHDGHGNTTDRPTSISIGLLSCKPRCWDYTGHISLNFFIRLTSIWMPVDGFRSGWYDSICSHPRYLAILERMKPYKSFFITA